MKAKKLVALVLALCMACSMAACGGNNNSSTSSGSSAAGGTAVLPRKAAPLKPMTPLKAMANCTVYG